MTLLARPPRSSRRARRERHSPHQPMPYGRQSTRPRWLPRLAIRTFGSRSVRLPPPRSPSVSAGQRRTAAARKWVLQQQGAAPEARRGARGGCLVCARRNGRGRDRLVRSASSRGLRRCSSSGLRRRGSCRLRRYCSCRGRARHRWTVLCAACGVGARLPASRRCRPRLPLRDFLRGERRRGLDEIGGLYHELRMVAISNKG